MAALDWLPLMVILGWIIMTEVGLTARTGTFLILAGLLGIIIGIYILILTGWICQPGCAVVTQDQAFLGFGFGLIIVGAAAIQLIGGAILILDGAY